jgi:hypothetical protein
VDIGPGANQTFVISLVPTAAFGPTDIQFGFDCTNTESAPTVLGVNTLLLTASLTPGPDIVALAITPSNDGIVAVPGPNGSAAFAVATANAGAGGTITVSADTGGAALPLAVALCETDPSTGACRVPPDRSVTRVMSPHDTPTFSVFVTSAGSVPFDPALHRVFVRFTDSEAGGGLTRGATSVAVRTR